MMDTSGMIFVFGSNLAGIHGAGAARYAYDCRGAQWGVGYGPTGECFAIPTKDKNIRTLRLSTIEMAIAGFITAARKYRNIKFQVTRIGCGLAGLKDEDIAPFFKDAPDNCYFDEVWKPYLPDKKYWGTF